MVAHGVDDAELHGTVSVGRREEVIITNSNHQSLLHQDPSVMSMAAASTAANTTVEPVAFQWSHQSMLLAQDVAVAMTTAPAIGASNNGEHHQGASGSQRYDGGVTAYFGAVSAGVPFQGGRQQRPLDIVSSLQQSSFNFLQESQIDLESEFY